MRCNLYKKLIIFFLLAVFLLNGVCLGWRVGHTRKTSFRPLGNSYPVAISPDQKRAAIIEVTSLTFRVRLFVDKKPGNSYSGIDGDSVTFSPDSQTVAYFAKQNKQWVFVIGDQEVKIFSSAKSNPIFSNDGKRCAAMIKDAGDWLVYIHGDGVHECANTKTYKNVKDFKFSADSSKAGYLAQLPDQKWVAVVNNQESPAYDFIKWLTFSPDSRHVAYGVVNGNKEYVVMDGKEEKQYDLISPSNFAFSPDSQSFAYVAHSGRKALVVNNGKEIGEYEGIAPNCLIYRQKLIYITRTVCQYQLIVDGKPEKAYDQIGFVMLNPNGDRLVYCAMDNRQWQIVDNGKEGSKYDEIAAPLFSANGEHFAYKARSGSKFFMVVDGVKQAEYDDIQNFIFSADGLQTAYLVYLNKEKFVVKNGREDEPCREIYGDTLTFSPDGSYFLYAAKKILDDSLYINGKKSGHFGKIVSRIVFDDVNKIHFIGVMESEVYNAVANITMHFTYCRYYDLLLQ